MLASFIALISLSTIHLVANHAHFLGRLWHGRFLSFASGVSFAYVFVDLLPQLAKGQPVLQSTIPYLSRHVYIVALLGVLFNYGMQNPSSTDKNLPFWISMSGFSFFNFLVGASLADPHNPDIQPLLLFTIAMGLHYFVNDHNLRQKHQALYEKKGRWMLVTALLAGWLIDYASLIPLSWIIIAMSFVSGGVLLNVLHYELPKRELRKYVYFVLGALIYTGLIVRVGFNL